MPAIKILRLLPQRRGAGFLSALGRFARPFLRNLAKNASPIVQNQLRKLGSSAIREGADLLTSAIVTESENDKKKQIVGGADNKSGGIKKGSKRKSTISQFQPARKRRKKVFGGKKLKKSKKKKLKGGKKKRKSKKVKRKTGGKKTRGGKKKIKRKRRPEVEKIRKRKKIGKKKLNFLFFHNGCLY